MKAEPRLEQHEFAVARNQELDHLLIAVALFETLAHQDAQILRQRRFGIVDRLVLANHAAQLLGKRSRPCFETGIRQNLIRLYGPCVWCRDEQHHHEQNGLQHPHRFYSAGCSAVLRLPGLAAGFGAPTRSRRSESEKAPPMTITTAPSQINITSGL